MVGWTFRPQQRLTRDPFNVVQQIDLVFLFPPPTTLLCVISVLGQPARSHRVHPDLISKNFCMVVVVFVPITVSCPPPRLKLPQSLQ